MLPSRELYLIKSRLSDSEDQNSRDARRLVEMTEELIHIVRNIIDAAPLICSACASDQNCGFCAVSLAKKFLYGDTSAFAPSYRVKSENAVPDRVM